MNSHLTHTPTLWNLLRFLIALGCLGFLPQGQGAPSPNQENDKKWATIDKLLDAGKIDIANAKTLFILAARQGRIEMLKKLASLGVSTHVTDEQGWTALHYAAGFAPEGRGIVWLLKEGKIDIGRRDKEGFTPLHRAAIMGHEKGMQLLVQEGADIYATGCGGTVLHCIAASPESQGRGIVWLLKEVGLDVEIRDATGATPFLVAVFCGNVKVMQVLQECGADLQAQDYHGRDATYYIQKIKDPQKKKEVEAWWRDNNLRPTS